MWGAIIGGAVGAGSAVYGGLTSSAAARDAKKRLAIQNEDTRAWYERHYNEDPTQRASAQRALTMMSEEARRRNRAAAGQAAVMGATDESVAATKAANAEAMANVASQIAAEGEARKDRIEDAYMARNSQFQQQMAGMDMQRANSIAQAVGGVANAAGQIATGLDGYFASTQTQTETQTSNS